MQIRYKETRCKYIASRQSLVLGILRYIIEQISPTFHQRMLGRKEGNVLFNDKLNTFYLRLYGFRHMAKDLSDSEKRNLLSPHELLFSNKQQKLFYMHHPTNRITHTKAFVSPVVERWLE